jgi:nucleoporin GLE1
MHLLTGMDEYVQIHQRLKSLRKFMVDHGKQDLAFKKKMGEMRREIRKSVGQLTEGKGANKMPVGALRLD